MLYLVDLTDLDVEADEVTIQAFKASLSHELAPGTGSVKAVAFVLGKPHVSLVARMTLDEPEFEDGVRFFPTRSEARAWLLT